MPYRYEDLGDEGFQRLCGAVIAHLEQTTQVPPLGQSDGGFDAFSRTPGTTLKVLGHQVKWTGHPDRISDPVAWILSQLNGEKEHLKKMGGTGTENYLLITNVPGTSKPGTGRMDRLDAALSRLGDEVNLNLWVWWRNDVDARIDAAPTALKFEYPDMLVGADAIRALIRDAHEATALRAQADLVKAAMATQYDRESTVGFRQGRLDGVPLRDLFVDVTARRPAAPGAPVEREPRGALQLLLARNAPSKTLLYGAPGQGKSTLMQMLCQEHRAALLGHQSFVSSKAFGQSGEAMRIPFKIVLRDLAVWLKGRDPFTVDEAKRSADSVDSVESFVARMLTVDSGGVKCGPAEINAVGNRYPTLFAFDGLDEVADIKVREKVVRLIEEFETRSARWECDVRVVVTSRPSFDRLPEPSNETHHPHSLDALGEKLRIEYLRKWARSQDLKPADRRELERIFRERSGEEHVRELGTNPMQLTILLYLIRQRGEAVPERRTDLYTDYLQAYLDREAEKSADVRTHRPLLEEVTAFLGWYLQSKAESDSGNGRAQKEELIREMKHFLLDHERPTEAVDVLFSAVTTRVWALTSRVTGTFEFDVQSIREYFAAKFLYERAPVTRQGTEAFARFSVVVDRPYWANTARLMAGLFKQGEKSQLADDLIDLIAQDRFRFWPRRISATLLRDGVFDGVPAALRRLVTAITDDIGIRLLYQDYYEDRGGTLPLDRGGRLLVERLQGFLENEPFHSLTMARASVLRLHLDASKVHEWIVPNLGKVESRDHWLDVVIGTATGDRIREGDLAAFDLTSESDAARLLAAGVPAPPGSDLDRAMMTALLSGRIATFEASGRSRAAALAGVVNTQRLAERSAPSTSVIEEWNRHSSALLERLDPDLAAALLAVRRATTGQKGSTLMFSRLADAMRDCFGRNWLANEIVLIAASAPELRAGHGAGRDEAAFGRDAQPSALVRDVVGHRKDASWWEAARADLTDQLDRVTWVVGLVVGTAPRTLDDLLTAFVDEVGSLDDLHYEIAAAALARFGQRPTGGLSVEFVVRAISTDLRSGSLLIDLMADEGVVVPEVVGASERWSLIRAYSLWHTLQPHDVLTPSDAEVLATAGIHRYFGEPKDWHIPDALAVALTPESPWSMLVWRDRDAEYQVEREPLAVVAARDHWS